MTIATPERRARKPLGARSRPGAHGAASTAGVDKLVAAIAAVLLWAAASAVVGSDTVPAPLTVARELGGLVGTSQFWAAVVQTLVSTALGVLVCVAIGVPLGILIGANAYVRGSTGLLVEFMRTIPPVAVIPLGLLLYGPSLAMKVLVIVLGAVWPMVLHACYSVRDIRQSHRDVATVFDVPRRVRWLHIYLPSILPGCALGLRIVVTVALLISVACEVVGGAPGVGNALVQAQVANDLPLSYAYIVTAALIGVALNLATHRLTTSVIGIRSRGEA
ncbi:ABC-type nitrate/sulfonate/bicarbonate transport system permease component [Branchiibius hedensis]|uniref:ABC-type nitrate/sulfonate/bicarbonate transport system, permease component n=1 Tax=Branchiibius hedensis TaxID=672460 RepID=A0A2Y8ZPS1_9MICO|nr:ABC transporter permease subunit [Branchiibius hedensis]PWJ25019.1 ABC-type nitrate/sulfonate/bicarbonate transport system permease component [Branchiibius hedensis]SSA33834.1 ABC-type nitrate/sulfonate/bicarbonate transport system, permease component [Branchiibius hedensis]